MFEWAAVGFIYAIGVLSVGPHQRAHHGRHLREVDSPGGAGRGQHPGDQFRSVTGDAVVAKARNLAAGGRSGWPNP